MDDITPCKKCKQCGYAFNLKRRDAKYCSDRCRTRAHRNKIRTLDTARYVNWNITKDPLMID